MKIYKVRYTASEERLAKSREWFKKTGQCSIPFGELDFYFTNGNLAKEVAKNMTDSDLVYEAYITKIKNTKKLDQDLVVATKEEYKQKAVMAAEKRRKAREELERE